jgi:DNA polymerase V
LSTTKPRKIIPITEEKERDSTLDSCASGEPFALMVLGDAMEPEFVEGDIILIEPEGLATDGSYVLAQVNEEWTFRQLLKDQNGGWTLAALNPAYPTIPVPGVREVVKGVIIQKSKPGRRKATKRYVDD